MNNDLTPAELKRLLKLHRKLEGSNFWEKPRCFVCSQSYPCLTFRMASEIQRRREAAGRQGALL